MNRDDLYNLQTLLNESKKEEFQSAIQAFGHTSIKTIVSGEGKAFLFHLLFHSIDFDWLMRTYEIDINSQDNDGKSLLFNIYRNIDVVKKLLKHNINIHLRDSEGTTAIYYYVQCGSAQGVINLLLEKGASLKEAKESFDKNTTYYKDLYKEAIDKYEMRERNCYISTVVFLRVGKKNIHKDAVTVIGKMIWGMRRREVWSFPAGGGEGPHHKKTKYV